MYKILLLGTVAHIFFLLSIFQIYFQSPVIVGLSPQNDLLNPPAKRLILFVADGLRDESLRRDDFQRTPFLRRIIANDGIYAVSHTRVPTESRPGHVALLAGLYEDPSAVLKGWQDNPVEFDSVFNRSRTSYAWGSPDIMRIFRRSNVALDAYDSAKEDFSGKSNTSLLDTWVFERVQMFLMHDIRDDDKSIYFLHLLGLDTAGHIHKPNTALFDDNLRLVDSGIQDIVERINRKFPDNRTAFVVTADHGMSNKGAHGAGTAHETETPFIAWGAGVHVGRNVADNQKRSYVKVNDVDVPQFDIQQADVTPFLSSLIGIASPMNNVGELPVQFLDTSEEYKANAIYNNALQIAAQYKHLQHQYSQGFFFKDYYALKENEMLSLEYEVQTALRDGNYKKSIQFSQHLLELTLRGIDYFRNYYETHLLLAVAIGMLGWIFFLYQQLGIDDNATSGQARQCSDEYDWKWLRIVISIALTVTIFVYVQKIDLQTGVFLVVPVLFWLPICTSNMLQVLEHRDTWLWIIGLELCVFTFFHRFVLSGLLLAAIAYEFIQLRDKKANIEMFFKWALNTSLLAVFPALPIIDKETNNIILLLLGIAAWGLKIFYALRNNPSKFKIINLAVFTIGALNHIAIINDLDNKDGLSEFKQMISWTVLICSFVMPLLSPNSFRDRLTAVLSSLCIPFNLMSLSYEPLFFMVFSSSIYYWVLMIYTLKRQDHSIPDSRTNSHSGIEMVEFKRAFISLLYILTSLFGTGNIASVSSFDPNWVRCLVSTFAPFLMASLIIIKLIIPVLLVMCAVKLIISITKMELKKFFIILLICCNIMCLNFLFLVKNTGSWLEIGTSISHFVIMEVTVLGLCLLLLIANALTTWQLDSLIRYGKTRDLSFNDAKVE